MTPRPVVVSVEQALAMPYATRRFCDLGWRVIRVEAPAGPGRERAGDPNRYVGRAVAPPDRAAYFVAPNVGKEALAIDLKQEAGRDLLARLCADLPADVFCTNTLPARHRALGIDQPTLAALRPGLVWCSISAMGTEEPDVPGYDPVLQALCGYMELTGEAGGPPLLCGLPVIDLRAGDEAFAQVILALRERDATGLGKRIDLSMARLAVSWLLTFLPLLDLGAEPEALTRAGNEHRQFIPTGAYATRDGAIYLAVGSDAQWRRLCADPLFAGLGRPEWAANEGRRAGRDEVHGALARVTSARATAETAAALARAQVPHAPILRLHEVAALPSVARTLLRTTAPDGRDVRLPPAAVDTPHLAALGGRLPFAPRLGEHTDAVLGEIGLSAGEIRRLRADGVVG